MILGLLAAAALVQKPIEVRTEPFSGLGSDGIEIGCMTLTSGHMLFGPEGFGGYSGLHLDTEEGVLTLLSDTASLTVMDIDLDPKGRVRGLSDPYIRGMYDIRGDRLHKKRGDTEAILPWQDGWLVTREGAHDAIRVAMVENRLRALETLVDLGAAEPLTSNGGFEAAARVGEDRYLFIGETTTEDGRAPMMAWTPGEEATPNGFYQTADGFDVTDAAADIAGDRLFVLERAFSPARGPRARVTVLPLSMAAENDGTLAPVELGRFGFFEGADNMEGIAAFRAEDSSDNLMLVSDDNFRDVQRTVLMTLRLGTSCALAPAQP